MVDSPWLLDPAHHRPSAALLGAQIALGSAIDRLAVAGTGHDPTTLDLLVRLDLEPGRKLRAVELCRRLQLSASHVSRMLDKAEAAGLVRRTPDPGDQRASLVAITTEGRGVVATFAPRLHAVLDDIVYSTLDSDEIDALVGHLDRIEAAARACDLTFDDSDATHAAPSRPA